MQGFLLSSADRYVRRRGRAHSGGPVSLSDDDWAWSDIFPDSANLTLSGAARAAGVVPLVANRVSLPTGSQTIPLLDVLPPDLKELYSSPDRLLREQPQPAPSSDVKSASRKPAVPSAKYFGSRTEYAKLIRRMRDLDMVEFTVSPRVVNGLFGVPKDVDRIRLITDARRANQVFVEPPKVKLPTPDLLAELTVDPSRPLYVAKVDLDNFYHRLSLPSWLRPFFALPPLPAREFGENIARRFGPNTLVYPCCTRLPMGWSHSVYLAQRIHEHLLDTRTQLRSEDRIVNDNDRFVDRVLPLRFSH